MTTCPKCGKAIPATVRYCAYCGAAVPRRPIQWLARVDWPFLGRWLAAAALSGVLAWLLLTHQYVSRALRGSGAAPLAALLAGVVIGAGQWVVLRGRLARSRRWLVALPLGWGAAFALWGMWPPLRAAYPWLEPAGRMVVPLAVLGAMSGYIQWPLARHYAWPASRWALVSALAPPVSALGVTLALPAEQGGWLMQIALRTGGRPIFSTTDLAIAGLIGLVLGLAQYPLIRRAVGLAPIWPLGTAAGLLAGALAVDGLFALTQTAAMGFGSPGVMVYWYQFAGGPAGAAVAWGLLGAGLGAGQAGFLRLTAALPPALAGRAVAAAQPEKPGRLWIPVTTAGAAAGALAAWPLIAGGWLLLAAAGAGLIVGLPQWWAAGPGFRYASWLPATAAAGWCLLVVCAQIGPAALPPGLAQAALSLPAILVVLAVLPGGVLALRN